MDKMLIGKYAYTNASTNASIVPDVGRFDTMEEETGIRGMEFFSFGFDAMEELSNVGSNI